MEAALVNLGSCPSLEDAFSVVAAPALALALEAALILELVLKASRATEEDDFFIQFARSAVLTLAAAQAVAAALALTLEAALALATALAFAAGVALEAALTKTNWDLSTPSMDLRLKSI